MVILRANIYSASSRKLIRDQTDLIRQELNRTKWSSTFAK